MTEIANNKHYDLEDRTLKFAKNVIDFTGKITKTISNIEIMKQLIRSSSSIGANYIEANEALSKKDFAMRIKICRKEAKETRYWLMLLDIPDKLLETKRDLMIRETTELMKIFGSILEKTK